jgi:hypothetical protein
MDENFNTFNNIYYNNNQNNCNNNNSNKILNIQQFINVNYKFYLYYFLVIF